MTILLFRRIHGCGKDAVLLSARRGETTLPLPSERAALASAEASGDSHPLASTAERAFWRDPKPSNFGTHG